MGTSPTVVGQLPYIHTEPRVWLCFMITNHQLDKQTVSQRAQRMHVYHATVLGSWRGSVPPVRFFRWFRVFFSCRWRRTSSTVQCHYVHAYYRCLRAVCRRIYFSTHSTYMYIHNAPWTAGILFIMSFWPPECVLRSRYDVSVPLPVVHGSNFW